MNRGGAMDPGGHGRPVRRRLELERPSVSALLWLAVAAWIGARAGTELALWSWVRGGDGGGWAPLTAVAAAFVVAALLRGRPGPAVLALGFAIAMAAGLSSGATLAATAKRVETALVTDRAGVVLSDARTGRFGTTVEVSLSGVPGTAIMKVPADVRPPAYGRRVVVSARLKPLPRLAPAAADAFREGTLVRASPWRLSDEGWVRGPLGAVGRWRAAGLHLLRGAGGVGADMLASMLFGTDATTVSARALLDARTAGVAWAVSASGLHLAALLLLVDRTLAFAGLGRTGRAVGAVAAAAVLALAGCSKPSLVRAAVAGAAIMVARALGRRRDATAALGAAALVMVVARPPIAYDIGLVLGALAVSSITVFGGLARAWVGAAFGRTAARLLSASITAQIAVGPLSASLFGGVALAGPIVLVASGPVVALSVSLGFVACLVTTVAPRAAPALAGAGARTAELAAAIWHGAAALPNVFIASAAIPGWVHVAWLVAAAALWWRWPKPRRAARTRAVCMSVVAALSLWSLLQPTVRTGLIILDVGQGDAILIRDGGAAVLVDTGPDPVALRRALARVGVKHLDGMVLTHAHDDHTGGLDGLAGVARPAWIGLPDVVDESVERLERDCRTRSSSVVRLRRDMTFTVGATRVRVLWPTGGERLLDPNDTSVILLVERAGERALLLGDAEDRAQRGALDAWAAAVDVVKVAHHGSPNGNVPSALELWRPRIALISVGAGNSFGHPSKAALDTLAEVGCVVHRTDREGDVSYGWHDAVSAARVASSARSVEVCVCDNPGVIPLAEPGRISSWHLPISLISNPSTSSTARRSCCWSAPNVACATVSLRWPTSTSTWRRSTGRPPPQMPS